MGGDSAAMPAPSAANRSPLRVRHSLPMASTSTCVFEHGRRSLSFRRAALAKADWTTVLDNSRQGKRRIAVMRGSGERARVD